MATNTTKKIAPAPTRLNTGPATFSVPGFPFTRESAIRRYAEPATFALFPYIAGLTVMDDRIAAAVSGHSTFQNHAWRRLLGTIQAAMSLVYGNEKEAYAVAERIHAMHTTIKGSKKNVSYHANDIHAQTWVLAAVFQGGKEAKRRWNPPAFTVAEEEALYQDFRVFAQFFGIHQDAMPATLDGFQYYWEERIAKKQLLQTQVSKEMVQAIFHYQAPKHLSPLGKISRAISLTALDPRLVEQSGLCVTPAERQLAARVDFVIRSTYGHIPDMLRVRMIPAYVTAQRAVRLIHKASAR